MYSILVTKFHQVEEVYSKSHPIIKFVVRGSLLYLIWLIFYSFFRHSAFIADFYEWFTYYLTNSWLYSAHYFLTILGFDSEVYPDRKIVQLAGTSGVLLNRGCLGRNMIGLFVGFIIAYPGAEKSKLWYIPLGLVTIYFINVLRIAGLSLSEYYFPNSYIKYNHHDIYKYTVYAFIFFLWYIWINYLNKPDFKRRQKSLELSHIRPHQSIVDAG